LDFDVGVLIFDGIIFEKTKKDEFFSNLQNKPPKSLLSGELIC